MSADSILGWTILVAVVRLAKGLAANSAQRRVEARRAAELQARA